VAVRFDHVGINVGDLAAATEWYCAAFDLTVELELAVEVFDLRIAMLKSPHGFRVELLARPGSRPGLRAPNPGEAVLTEGYGHAAFAVADLDAVYGHLMALGAGAVMPPCPSPEPGVRMAYLHDPEGNLIELVERG
jgi:catechol 2,3-dioxygenase-like lactoylglutathione lyase family enzyme